MAALHLDGDAATLLEAARAGAFQGEVNGVRHVVDNGVATEEGLGVAPLAALFAGCPDDAVSPCR